ncbi:unnamed protein product [Calypogeia fissa]
MEPKQKASAAGEAIRGNKGSKREHRKEQEKKGGGHYWAREAIQPRDRGPQNQAREVGQLWDRGPPPGPGRAKSRATRSAANGQKTDPGGPNLQGPQPPVTPRRDRGGGRRQQKDRGGEEWQHLR